jgi:hypothetical protein
MIYTVIKSQRIGLSFVKVQRARIEAILLYWDNLEATWWSQRNKAAGKGIKNDSSENLEDKKNKNKKKKKDEGEKISLKIPL